MDPRDTPPRLPVGDPAFWKARLDEALLTGELHKAVYNTDIATWQEIGNVHKTLLYGLLGAASPLRLLDCGCGYGALLEYLPDSIIYTGVDLSSDFIALAKRTYPTERASFYTGRLESLPFANRSFDVAVCRSIEGTIIVNQGEAAWREVEREILRVADRLIVMGYGEPSVCRVTDAVDLPNEFCRNMILSEHGRLVYRPGQDGSCEIYELIVEEGHRSKGEGTKLVKRLEEQKFHTLYGFTRVTNQRAIDFYKRLGFRMVRIAGFYRGMSGVMFIKRGDIDVNLLTERGGCGTSLDS